MRGATVMCEANECMGMEGDGVDRRKLLSLTGVIVAAATNPQVAADLARVQHGGLDAGWAAAAQRHTRMLVGAYRNVKPNTLLPHVQAHLDVLGTRAGEPANGRVGRAMGRVVAETSALGGELAMVMQRWGQADGYLAVAERAAKEAEDPLLEAQVRGLSAIRHSRIPRGEVMPSGEAVTRLEQAAAAVRHGGPALTSAWLHAKLAVEYAAGNRGAAAAKTMTVAERMLDRGEDEREESGLWSAEALLEYLKGKEALRGFEGVALLVLGDPGAKEPLEAGIAGAEGSPTGRGSMHADLVAVYATAGQPEKAVEHGHLALDLVEETGFWVRRERVKARAKTLRLWRGLGIVREFEERVRMVA